MSPNWFAAVMGTAIVAIAAAGLPQQVPGLHSLGLTAWAVAVALLVWLLASSAVIRGRGGPRFRGYALDPAMAPFYGAPPIALLSVGVATLLLGRDVLGLRAAVDIDWVLWIAGTAGGLLCAVIVPYLLFTRHEVRSDSVSAGWLMPVVPTIVSASGGALLAARLPPGQLQLSLLMSCYAMLGIGVLCTLMICPLIWQRLAQYKTGPAPMAPTVWIVLGPFGQSITAANLLAADARRMLPEPYGHALQAFGLVYGVPVWGFTLLWITLATALTVRAARASLPFSPAWWSYTFPLGTCVTASSGLTAATGIALFRIVAPVLFIMLVAAWLLVATSTVRSALHSQTRRY